MARGTRNRYSHPGGDSALMGLRMGSHAIRAPEVLLLLLRELELLVGDVGVQNEILIGFRDLVARILAFDRAPDGLVGGRLVPQRDLQLRAEVIHLRSERQAGRLGV